MNYPINENGRTIGNTSFADMIAQAQVVTDIDNSIAAMTTSLLAVSASALVETNRAIASENNIQAFVTAETSRAGFAETGIKASVVVETARAKAAEVVLTTAVTALQSASSSVAQDTLLTSWFFGVQTNSFGSQYIRDYRSLNVNIRVYLLANLVTLTLSAACVAADGGNTAIYNGSLPAYARPAADTSLVIVVYTSNMMNTGYLLISPNGLVRLFTLGSWHGSSGLMYDVCVSYLV